MDAKNSDAEHIMRDCVFFTNDNVSQSGGYSHTDDKRYKECWYLYDQRLNTISRDGARSTLLDLWCLTHSPRSRVAHYFISLTQKPGFRNHLFTNVPSKEFPFLINAFT